MTGPAVAWTRHCPNCGGSGRGTWEEIGGIWRLTAVEHGVRREGQAVICRWRPVWKRLLSGHRSETGKHRWVRTIGPAMAEPA